MNMKYVLSVTVNPALDHVFKVTDFKIGSEQYGRSVFLSAGGKGINVCRGLRGFNVACVATGFIGGFTGQWILDILKQERIRADFLTIPGRSRTNLTFIDPGTHRITRLLEHGPRITVNHANTFLKKFRFLCTKAVIVVISGSVIPGAGDVFYRKLISLAHRLGKEVVLDTSKKALVCGIREKPFMIKPNKEEAESILNMSLSSIRQKREALRRFVGMGIKNVCITLGSKGAIASNGEDFLIASVPPQMKRHAVGCGDAFVAGFVYSYLRQYKFKDCVCHAVAAGTASMVNPYPGSLDEGQVKRMVKRVRLKSL